ncbi:jg10507 [Pararge aegeria aegeria]|uniref:Jg10507 protein n=1 Tax=Pararge aegeria aegeria TaxID=348720 RepID=A0A8S4RL89_9NEOP|nr:jg10507 [Pararge aegeria aegeria]
MSNIDWTRGPNTRDGRALDASAANRANILFVSLVRNVSGLAPAAPAPACQAGDAPAHGARTAAHQLNSGPRCIMDRVIT